MGLLPCPPADSMSEKKVIPGQGICLCINHSFYVRCLHVEIELSYNECQASSQVHCVLVLGGSMIDNAYYCHVITLGQNIFPRHKGPQMAAEMMMGTISFTVIWQSEIGPAHFSMNQLGPE